MPPAKNKKGSSASKKHKQQPRDTTPAAGLEDDQTTGDAVKQQENDMMPAHVEEEQEQDKVASSQKSTISSNSSDDSSNSSSDSGDDSDVEEEESTSSKSAADVECEDDGDPKKKKMSPSQSGNATGRVSNKSVDDLLFATNATTKSTTSLPAGKSTTFVVAADVEERAKTNPSEETALNKNGVAEAGKKNADDDDDDKATSLVMKGVLCPFCLGCNGMDASGVAGVLDPVRLHDVRTEYEDEANKNSSAQKKKGKKNSKKKAAEEEEAASSSKKPTCVACATCAQKFADAAVKQARVMRLTSSGDDDDDEDDAGIVRVQCPVCRDHDVTIHSARSSGKKKNSSSEEDESQQQQQQQLTNDSTGVDCNGSPCCYEFEPLTSEEVTAKNVLNTLHPSALSDTPISATQQETLTLCGICEEAAPTVACLECGFGICDECQRTVHSKGRFKKHTVVPFSQLAKSKQRKCPLHPTHNLDVYCQQCNECICLMCSIGGHQGHPMIALSEMNKKMEEAVGNSTDLVKHQANKLDTLLAKLQGSMASPGLKRKTKTGNTAAATGAKRKRSDHNESDEDAADNSSQQQPELAVRTTVQRVFERLREALDHREKEVLSQLDTAVQKTSKEIASIADAVETTKAELECGAAHVFNCFDQNHPTDFMRLYEVVNRRVDELLHANPLLQYIEQQTAASDGNEVASSGASIEHFCAQVIPSLHNAAFYLNQAEDVDATLNGMVDRLSQLGTLHLPHRQKHQLQQQRQQQRVAAEEAQHGQMRHRSDQGGVHRQNEVTPQAQQQRAPRNSANVAPNEQHQRLQREVVDVPPHITAIPTARASGNLMTLADIMVQQPPPGKAIAVVTSAGNNRELPLVTGNGRGVVSNARQFLQLTPPGAQQGLRQGSIAAPHEAPLAAPPVNANSDERPQKAARRAGGFQLKKRGAGGTATTGTLKVPAQSAVLMGGGGAAPAPAGSSRGSGRNSGGAAAAAAQQQQPQDPTSEDFSFSLRI